jgi:hypothetical protein
VGGGVTLTTGQALGILMLLVSAIVVFAVVRYATGNTWKAALIILASIIATAWISIGVGLLTDWK